MKRVFSILLMALFALQASAQLPSISNKTKGLQKKEGYFNYWYDETADKILLEIDKPDKEFLYVNSLTAGIGSNDIGLDRGQLGGTRVVYFERRGPKVLLIQPNYGFRAETDNHLEKKSVGEAFASSVLAGFKIEAEEDGRLLIDLTPFLIRDAHSVSETLEGMRQGSYRLDKERSALFPGGILNFPQNTEFEATLTFGGTNPGGLVRSVVPTPEAITVRQHHSFIQLPDDNYEPREMDPRSGFFGISYQDYGTPIQESLVKRYISRHRLEKKNPEAEISEPVEPIVYYLDNGTPEPVRSALLDGARWWNQAFEAAGYKDAFIVKILPENAHPLDVRYNVIQWVHRSTRGWSYGSSVTDPRTGEIIKGHVSLGSLRVRQDFLIAEGLLAPYKDGEGDDAVLEMALARIRQLSAHEVGHTIGLAHNFAASTNGDASVMDYPHPQAKITGGEIDLSNPYDTGIGEWDKVAVRYGYQDYPEGTDVKEELNEILESAFEDGLRYISDNDARPTGGAHPMAHLWDYGKDPVTQLPAILEIRERALEKFGTDNLEKGKALASLEQTLVPIYFFHRYQIEGTVKLIGGLDYTYKLKGDNQYTPKIVDAAVQRKALTELLKTIDPEVLSVPEKLLELIPPRPSSLGYSRELFNGNTGPALDALGIAETAADMSLSLILHPQRANRLVEYGAREGNLDLNELIGSLMDASWNKDYDESYKGAVQRTVNFSVLKNLMKLAASDQAHMLTRSVVMAHLKNLQEELSKSSRPDDSFGAHLIGRFMEDPSEFAIPEAQDSPPGSPIGMGSGSLLQCSF